MIRYGLEAMAKALADGSVTSQFLVAEALEAAHASIAVFIKVLDVPAMAEAKASDQRRSEGKPLGPYDGVPYAAKDLFDVAGEITTAGSRTRHHVAPSHADAAIIATLRRQGLVLIGKTNLSEFAFSGLGLNPHFGTPTPRYDATRVPGGSSSGSAIAIEGEIVPLALGTDTAGSMRVPAAFNGLVGFRASQGRYDNSGVFPLARSFDVPGPMARSVADCAAFDALMRGVDVGSVSSSESPPHFLLDTQVLQHPSVTNQVREKTLAFAETLERLGAKIERRPVKALVKTLAAISELGWLGGTEAAEFHCEMLDGPERALVDPRVLHRLDLARQMPEETIARLQSLRVQFMGDIAGELGRHILLTPTVGHNAPLLAPLELDPELFARTNLDTLRLTMLASFLDMPALALPTEPNRGPPYSSVQLSAVRGLDELVLGAGLWVETALLAVSA
jgi:aspartyl-tRNA(Asn)/glutamyl-tRNA(Gln) amidotransferase subunit A